MAKKKDQGKDYSAIATAMRNDPERAAELAKFAKESNARMGGTPLKEKPAALMEFEYAVHGLLGVMHALRKGEKRDADQIIGACRALSIAYFKTWKIADAATRATLYGFSGIVARITDDIDSLAIPEHASYYRDRIIRNATEPTGVIIRGYESHLYHITRRIGELLSDQEEPPTRQEEDAETAYPANWFKDQNGLLPNTLNRARIDGRVQGEKRAGRWFYRASEVRKQFPDSFSPDDET